MPKENPAKEKTVVLLKPDVVKRGLTGEIITRFEKAGLKIVGLKMVWVEAGLVAKHYPDTKEYLTQVGQKTQKPYEEYGKAPHEERATKAPYEIGKRVRNWNMFFGFFGPTCVKY